MPKLSHYDNSGKVRMVDVTAKSITHRTAQAHAFVYLPPKVLAAIRKLKNPKYHCRQAHLRVDTSLSSTPSHAH
jgi:molybdenum cofactor biosynthesis enzyme